jgi:DNA-binding NtrC family response regulator
VQEAAASSAPGTFARRILVAEDDATTRSQLQKLLSADPRLQVDTAADGRQALELLSDGSYSIVITDLKMPQLNGMQLIEEVQQRRLAVSVIVTTGFGSIDDAVRAMQLGATDFLAKPIDLDHLRMVVERALRQRELQDEVNALRTQLHERHSFRNMLSKNVRMHEAFELIGCVAPTNTTVLIEGETGTGKEEIARAIHAASRRGGPLVAVNCAALPETLLESELFGHEKGAFTGAVGQRRGRFELADKGTIFLDEVGDIPPAMQAKLLRVLQERRFERVGGTDSIEVDVRVLAATNRSLQKLVEQGQFREDLYYRLNVVKIAVPPLRERTEDIPLLAAHFCQKYVRPGEPIPVLASEALERLLAHPWPGNVRELENAIERACVTTREPVIRAHDLPQEIVCTGNGATDLKVDLSRPLPEQLDTLISGFEENYLRGALAKCRGHIGNCARVSGLSRRSVTQKISRYGIDKGVFKSS